MTMTLGVPRIITRIQTRLSFQESLDHAPDLFLLEAPLKEMTAILTIGFLISVYLYNIYTQTTGINLEIFASLTQQTFP